MIGCDELSSCVVCGSRSLATFLDLGSQPLANAYHDGSQEQPAYPLAVAGCEECWHNQLTVAVDPSLMFDHYHYVSDTAQTLRGYFSWFADDALRQRGPCDVLELACNCGALLEQFAQRDCRCLGVDPAKNLRPLSLARGLDVLVDYWGSSCLDAHPELVGRFDVIVAMNVLAHTPDPLGFLTAARMALKDSGSIYVQTSQCQWLENGEFDSVYHEHLSYFTVSSLETLAARAGLRVADIRQVPIHGTSMLVELTKTSSCGPPKHALSRSERRHWTPGAPFPTMPAHAPASPDVTIVNQRKRIAERAASVAAETRRTIEEYRADGMKAIGYGAAAKGNTFLNYAGIDLDYIVDDNPLKQGLFTPGRNIPVVPPSRLADEEQPLLILALAWNFVDEIRARVTAARPSGNDVFVTYFPKRLCTELPEC